MSVYPILIRYGSGMEQHGMIQVIPVVRNKSIWVIIILKKRLIY